jgi:hypothetical protein
MSWHYEHVDKDYIIKFYTKLGKVKMNTYNTYNVFHHQAGQTTKLVKMS